ncbi:MAG: aminotransferase class V-fold PLP-dependent enzyme [Elusimicrobiota bacterium]
MKEIYFDNAATSFPKPPEVLAAINDYSLNLGASAGRGAYPRALATGKMIYDTRQSLSRLFNVADSSRIVFTFNCTDGLNLAIQGLTWKKDDEALVSMMEHNSVIRPLNVLKEKIGIKIKKIECDNQGFLNLTALKQAITKKTKLIAVVQASNVTGTIQPIAQIGLLAGRYSIPFLVDAAQSAGALPIDVQKMNIDLLAFPGHKSLLGPLGTGGLYIAPHLSLEPLKTGGTGSVSEQEVHPDFLPDKYEAGSHNALGIAGLKSALAYLQKTGLKQIRRQEKELTECFLKGLKKIPGVIVYGPGDAARQVAVISLNLAGYAPNQLAELLAKKYGLMTRSGLHCAPLAHRSIGAYPLGTVRFSFGCLNTFKQIDIALQSLKKIAQ